MFETSATERKNKTQLCNTVQMTTVQTCTAAQTTAWWTVQHYCTVHWRLPPTTTNDDDQRRRLFNTFQRHIYHIQHHITTHFALMYNIFKSYFTSLSLLLNNPGLPQKLTVTDIATSTTITVYKVTNKVHTLHTCRDSPSYSFLQIVLLLLIFTTNTVFCLWLFAATTKTTTTITTTTITLDYFFKLSHVRMTKKSAKLWEHVIMSKMLQSNTRLNQVTKQYLFNIM